MKIFPFVLLSEEDVILVQAWIEGYEIRLAIDTAATHTVIDSNVLLMLGFSMEGNADVVAVETGGGIIEANHIELQNFNALGVSKRKYIVLSYDFLNVGIVSTYDGVLGLDFFRDCVLTINFNEQYITVESFANRKSK